MVVSILELRSFDGAERLEQAECKALRTSGSFDSRIHRWCTFRRARFGIRSYRQCSSFRPQRWKDSAAVAPWDLVLVARIVYAARAASKTRTEALADAVSISHLYVAIGHATGCQFLPGSALA